MEAATREMPGDVPTWTRPATGRESTGLWFRDAIALLMASALVVLLSWSGWVADAQATLVQMGFDPDRGQLLVGMLMAALAAAVARLIAGRSAPPILASLLGFAAVYGGTFLSETRDALKPAADQGTFDPAGWSMTLLALTVAVVVTGWAASVLAGIVRSQLVISWGDLHDLARSRSRRSAKVARPMAVLAVVALLALTGPVLGDMLNFGPQIHMRQTSSMPVGLFGGAPSTAGDLPSTMPGDSGLSIGVSAGATDRARPWEAWRPTGSATLTSVVFPAPWVGGTATTLKASIYLPPGYATGSQRYPVLYEVPWSLYLWEGGLGFPRSSRPRTYRRTSGTICSWSCRARCRTVSTAPRFALSWECSSGKEFRTLSSLTLAAIPGQRSAISSDLHWSSWRHVRFTLESSDEAA